MKPLKYEKRDYKAHLVYAVYFSIDCCRKNPVLIWRIFMKRVRMVLAYDGTNYCGWQLQPNGITIEEVLNQASLRTSERACCGYRGQQDRFRRPRRRSSGGV